MDVVDRPRTAREVGKAAVSLNRIAPPEIARVLSDSRPISPRGCGCALMAAYSTKYYRPRYWPTKPKGTGSDGSWRRSRTTSKLIDRKGGGYDQTAIFAR